MDSPVKHVSLTREIVLDRCSGQRPLVPPSESQTSFGCRGASVLDCMCFVEKNPIPGHLEEVPEFSGTLVLQILLTIGLDDFVIARDTEFHQVGLTLAEWPRRF